jgi:hypothetical protein
MASTDSTSSILDEQREHRAIISAWGRGERVQVRECYSGRVFTVCGTSRWDEGLCVSDDARVFMLRTRFEVVS